MLPSKYVVIDIETTGFDRKHDRIIEIAGIYYEKGRKISEFHSLVNPGIPIPPEITALTGITQEDVINAPSIDLIKPLFLNFIDCYPVIGHNILTFDAPFIAAQMQISFDNAFIDTLPLSQCAFPRLPCHKLSFLNEILQLGSLKSHRALSDVETTNELLLACQSPEKYEPLIEQASASNTFNSYAARQSKDKKSKRRFRHTIDIHTFTPSCGCPDPSGPLCGKIVVFTGTLSIPREKAMQIAVNAGAILKTSVTLKTSYLVVGVQDISVVGTDGKSSKEERAYELNAAGKTSIQIITEDEFLRLAEKVGENL